MSGHISEPLEHPLAVFPDTQTVGKRAIILVPPGYKIGRMLLFHLHFRHGITFVQAFVFPGTPQEHSDIEYITLEFPVPTLVSELHAAAQKLVLLAKPEERDLLVLPIGYALGGAVWSLLIYCEQYIQLLFTCMKEGILEGSISPNETPS